MKVRLQADLQIQHSPSCPLCRNEQTDPKFHIGIQNSQRNLAKEKQICWCPTCDFKLIANTQNSLAHTYNHSKTEHLEIRPHAYGQLTLTKMPKQVNKDKNHFNT